MTVSDHVPAVLAWDIGHRPTTKQWRVNASLLNDKDFIMYVITELRNYLDVNDKPLLSCCGTVLRHTYVALSSHTQVQRNKRSKIH